MSKYSIGGAAAIIVALAVAGTQTTAGQEFSSALTLPFSTTASGAAGAVQTSGSFRILQFFEQNGQAYAVGTLTIGVPDQASTTGASVRSFVTQAVVPVLAVTSRSTAAALAFGAGTAATTATGQSIAGSTVAATITTAGVPSSSTPGQVANCGPLHVEVGPIDVNQAGVALHLDRLAVDIAPPSGGVSTMLSSAMCGADAALTQAANGGNTTGAAFQQPGAFGAPAGALTPGVTTTGAPTAGSTTFGGMATTAGTFGYQPTAAGTFNGAATTPLQSFVSVLNQVIGML